MMPGTPPPSGHYLQFKSPHELSPGERSALAPVDGDPSDPGETSQETQPADAPSTDEQQDSSDAASDAEPQQDKPMRTRRAAAKVEAPRRSGRKRRPVDVLSPQDFRKDPSPVLPTKSRRTPKEFVEELMKDRPTTRVVAAVRAEAAKREKAQSSARRTKKAKKSVEEESPKGVLSPVQDEQKKTPQKKRTRKARRSLEPSYPAVETKPEAAYSHDTETKFVSDLIAELYEEQEQDDRSMYDITRDTVVAETSTCPRSQEVKDLSMEEFRRLMTYGEVSVESMSSVILPFLKLEEDDVFFDLGCGTGKILVQAAILTTCKRAIGIELMQNRVQEGQKALKRLNERKLDVLQDKHIEIFCGDMFEPPEEAGLMDASVVFINNVMFGPQLMLKVLALLKAMPKLKRVVTLRKICERHGKEKCERAGNYCIEYVHPPEEAEIDVSWADKTSVYLYESVDFSVSQLTRQWASITGSSVQPQ